MLIFDFRISPFIIRFLMHLLLFSLLSLVPINRRDMICSGLVKATVVIYESVEVCTITKDLSQTEKT